MKSMNRIDLLKECSDAKTIGISGHIRPDGDCIGACLGLYLYLKKVFPEKEITVYLEKTPEIFDCIKDIDKIEQRYGCTVECCYCSPPRDVFIALDCSKDRLGRAEELFDAARKKINIDHHVTNSAGCGDVNYVIPEASSTCELICNLLEDAYLDIDIAKALYIGIIHDTGVLQYSNTKPETLQTVAKLIGYGFDFPKLIDETFYEKTYVQSQIMGRALLESVLFMDGKCVVSVVDKKTMDFYGVTPKDLDGIVNQLRIIKGVECAIFLYEIGTLEYKVSMRSCGVINVSKISAMFGGGGHARAAGCTMNGTSHDVINNISEQIEKQFTNGEDA